MSEDCHASTAEHANLYTFPSHRLEHWEAGADLFAHHTSAVSLAYAQLEAEMLATDKLRKLGWQEVQPGHWAAPRRVPRRTVRREVLLVLAGAAVGVLVTLIAAWVSKL